jgi:hypothetical protein
MKFYSDALQIAISDQIATGNEACPVHVNSGDSQRK